MKNKLILFLLFLAPLLSGAQGVSDRINVDRIYSRVGRGVSIYDTLFIKKGLLSSSLDNTLGMLGITTPGGKVVYLPFQQFVDSIGGGYISGDTIYVGGDTLIAASYWDKTGNDIENNNSGKVTLTKDSTYFSGIPDEATKTGRLLHVNQNGKVEYVHFMDLYRYTQDSIRETPTAEATWVRDTTNGILSPATATDHIIAQNFQYSEVATDRYIAAGEITLSAGTKKYNTMLGWHAGNEHVGDYGTFIGAAAGNKDSSTYTTSVGFAAGSQNKGNEGVFIGRNAGSSSTGARVTAAGGNSGWEQIGNGGVFYGYNSGWFNNGDSNTGIGNGASESCTGEKNTFTGFNAGYYSTTSFSIGYGWQALRGNTANKVIAIGYNAGLSNTDSATFILKHSACNATPLINGNLLTNMVNMRKLTIDTLLTVTDSLHVGGDAEFDEDVNVGGNLDIASTTSTVGQFTRDKTRFLHMYTDNASQPNMFIGETAGNFTTTGNFNYTLGNNALQNNTTGLQNIAAGAAAMNSNTEGAYNMAIGGNALYNNKTGSNNVAVGYGAQYGISLDNVSSTVSIGTEAGLNNMGDGNIAIGTNAMSGGGSSTGADNVCIGALVMYPKTTGSRNVGIGKESLRQVTGGNYNTGIGMQSLYSVTTGEYNLALGYSAGKYITGSYKGVIDVGDKGSYANDTTQSLLFMNFASNTLRINGAEINPKGTLANNDVSPSVAGGNVWQYNGTANSVTLDALDDHVVGAFYTIIGNSDTYTITVIDGTPSGGDSFNLAGGNWVGGSQDVLMLYCIASDAFVEVSRSNN